MKIIKNYKNTIILLTAIIIGAIIGIIFKEKASVLSPFGDIFINLMFVVIVPLIFLTISTAIIKMENPKRLGKIFSRIIIVFIIMSVIAALIGIVTTKCIKLVDASDTNKIMELMDNSVNLDNDISILKRTANLITVSDFSLLLNKNNIIALLVFTIIFAFAVRKSKEKAEPVKKLLFSLNDIVLNIVNIIMYYAPIGLGCYFAALIGTYGNTIAFGFLKTFIIYTIIALFIYFVVYPLYIILNTNTKGLKKYFKNIITPTATALATCSSAACIPVNIKAAKDMGVSSDIAEATVPMGTSFHKDGSVLGSVFKIMFLVYLFEMSPSIFSILGTSLLATLLITAIPVGGGTISEMFIITLMGFSPATLPILTIIATVIDAPATVLNVVGDTTSSIIVHKMVDKKLK